MSATWETEEGKTRTFMITGNEGVESMEQFRRVIVVGWMTRRGPGGDQLGGAARSLSRVERRFPCRSNSAEHCPASMALHARTDGWRTGQGDGEVQIEQRVVACPIRAQYSAHSRSLTANYGQPLPFLIRRPPSQSLTGFVFQAGHASSILVTRSRSSLLVNSLSLCPSYSTTQMTRMTRRVMCIS
jgi:hypothetical protein